MQPPTLNIIDVYSFATLNAFAKFERSDPNGWVPFCTSPSLFVRSFDAVVVSDSSFVEIRGLPRPLFVHRGQELKINKRDGEVTVSEQKAFFPTPVVASSKPAPVTFGCAYIHAAANPKNHAYRRSQPTYTSTIWYDQTDSTLKWANSTPLSTAEIDALTNTTDWVLVSPEGVSTTDARESITPLKRFDSSPPTTCAICEGDTVLAYILDTAHLAAFLSGIHSSRKGTEL